MKGFLLAVASMGVLVVLSMVLLRVYRGRKYYRMFLLAFAGALGFYSFCFYRSSPDLGFLPSEWMLGNAQSDFWNGVLVLSLTFHLYWNTTYAVALTGFSSNLMIHLAQPHGRSLDELLEIYGAKLPLDGVLAWRIDNLIKGRCLVQGAMGFQLLPKGRVVARIGRFLKMLYGVKGEVS